jgi:uncharacterized membrane protein YwaF
MDWLLELKWGSFTPTHFISLGVAVLFAIGLHFALRKRSEKVKTWVMFALSLYGIFALVYEFIVWGVTPETATGLQYLPLHMCAYNALLTPVLILTKNKVLGNMLPLFATGAAIALVFNSIQADYPILSFTFFSYFFTHTTGACLPFLMISLGMVKPDTKYILPTAATTLGIYTLSHFANLIINNYLASVNFLDWQGELIQVNYMFSVHPQGNPLLSLFWSIIPFPYFYMLCALPIIVIYFLLLNCKQVVAWVKKKINARKNAA